ncbi:hypothetical protein [Kitasatospora sp. NPDC050543]|uniref:hypothetical protein n=1 Tax=Kitasatospora sp. NPDC050543 TaxID=3364054 RepID=UPI00378BD2F0
MRRQFARDTELSVPGARWYGPGAHRRRLVGTGVSAILVAGLLIGWNSPFSVAQQSPDTWSAERRAVLPAGLAVQLDFSAVPGVSAAAEPGRLAERAGGGRGEGPYSDGLKAGDPAETFRITEDRPQTDGSWRTPGALQPTFSRPVRNPRPHVSGLAALATGKGGSTSGATRLTVTGGTPGAPSLAGRTGWPGWTLVGNALAPAVADGSADGAPDAEGSVQLAGTFTAPPSADQARARALAALPAPPAPPAPPVAATGRSASGGRRAALGGGLLLLAAVGLITRRVFGRGPGGRRR